jgi:hypothetical protein
MHWRTFEKLAARAIAAEAPVWVDLETFLRRVKG